MGITDILSNPRMLHAMVVHFPVALAILGVPLVYLSAVVATDRNGLRWLCALCYLALLGFAVAAAETGEAAKALVPPTVSPEVSRTVEQHMGMGQKVWMFAAATAALLVLSTLRIRVWRVVMMFLAMLMSLATGGWVAATAHYGGMLVYKYDILSPVMPRAPAQTGAPPAANVPLESEVLPLEPLNAEKARQVRYEQDVKPIFEAHCTGCHGSVNPPDDLNLTTIDDMLKGGTKAGPAVAPGKPDDSPIIKYVRGLVQPRMPYGKPPLSPQDIQTLRMWIAAGAKPDTGM